MSPRRGGRGYWAGRFPRVSGDEPDQDPKFSCMLMFSPRERG